MSNIATFPALSPAGILTALIQCPSVTPAEGGALAYLEGLLGGAGFKVDRPVFTDRDTPDIENLFATIGTDGPHLVFAGHTDVVPTGPSEGWRHPPFAAKIEDGVLYGRGAVDMKGGIACFAAAALSFIEDGGLRSGRISFLITGDEEGPAVNGTVKLLRWAAERGHRFDASVVGEPTNPQAVGDAIKIGRRGSLSGTLKVSGKQGHVAYPHLADNPVTTLVRLLSALRPGPLDEGTENFQPSNLEITSVDVGNPAFNVIPGEAVARFNIRFNDRWTFRALEQLVRERLDGAAAGKQYTLTLAPAVSDVFLTHSNRLPGMLSDAVREVTGRTPELSTSGGTSDARFIKDYCPVVEFGLVGQTMHQIDERVPLADLDTLAAIYRRFLERFFAPA